MDRTDPTPTSPGTPPNSTVVVNGDAGNDVLIGGGGPDVLNGGDDNDYLVSRGEKTPWRLKLRSASFNNVAVLAEVLPGNLIADMVAILGSMFFVVGDVDK